MNLIPAWLQITTSISTTVGVLIALYVAVWREPRKARRERDDRDAQATEDRDRYNDQMAALQRAEDDRIAAQARKIVPEIASGGPVRRKHLACTHPERQYRRHQRSSSRRYRLRRPGRRSHRRGCRRLPANSTYPGRWRKLFRTRSAAVLVD